MPGENATGSWRDVDWEALRKQVFLDSGPRVDYVEYGSGTGTPLLLLHGLGASWQVWLENLVGLGDGRRVIALDLPGFGTSPFDPEVLSHADFAAVVAEFCEALELPAVTLVGNSLGGWIGASVASTYPDLAHGLVLVDAAGLFLTRRERALVVRQLRFANRILPWTCRNREMVASRPSLRRAAFRFAINRADHLESDLALQLLPPEHSKAFGPVLEEALSNWEPTWLDRLAAIKAPTLIVWGERDRQISVRHAARWAKYIPHASTAIIPKVGHLPMVEDPATFNEKVREFVSEIDR